MGKSVIKKKGPVNIEKLERTGIYTIDMIMTSIYFYRKKMRNIDTIYLNTYHWSQFDSWARKNAPENIAELDEINFDFDGVKIKKNPLRMNEEISFTFYPDRFPDRKELVNGDGN